MLSDSLPYFPDDAVLLAVVDPNVGKDRDVAWNRDGRCLVGPDNGCSLRGGPPRAAPAGRSRSPRPT